MWGTDKIVRSSMTLTFIIIFMYIRYHYNFFMTSVRFKLSFHLWLPAVLNLAYIFGKKHCYGHSHHNCMSHCINFRCFQCLEGQEVYFAVKHILLWMYLADKSMLAFLSKPSIPTPWASTGKLFNILGKVVLVMCFFKINCHSLPLVAGLSLDLCIVIHVHEVCTFCWETSNAIFVQSLHWFSVHGMHLSFGLATSKLLSVLDNIVFASWLLK